MPRWLTDPNHNKYTLAKQQELRLAREVGGKRLPNSGGARRSKWDQHTAQGGDFESDEFLFEHKSTVKNSIALKKAWFTNVQAGAERLAKLPALIVTFNEHGGPLDLVVVRKADLCRVTKAFVGQGKR
jgi:hypothetical protein